MTSFLENRTARAFSNGRMRWPTGSISALPSLCVKKAVTSTTPPILAAGLFKFSDMTGPHGNGIRGAAVIAAVCAAICAVGAVHYLTRYFRNKNLIPFGIYCISFGAFMTVFTLVVGAPAP